MKINNTINAGIVDQSGADKEMFNASQINSVPVSKQTLYDNYTLIYDEINEEWNFKLEDDELIELSKLENFTGTENIVTLGTITTGSWNANIIPIEYGGTGNTTGNAVTASKLQTARNIGGVSFDGSADIDLPGVNTIGNQSTTGNAATASKILSIDNDNIVQLTSEQTLSNKTLTSLNGLTINSEKEVNIGNNRIQNVSDPIDIHDAATKSYVDSVAEGLHIQESCRLATTENITLSGIQIIDGIETIEGDRILVKDQEDKTKNGIYDVSSEGGWTRSSDFDEPNEIKAGDFVFVTDGILNGSHGYVMTQTSEVNIGDTDITWTQFSGAGQIEGGDGISKNGNQLSVDLKSEGGLTIESTKLGVDLGNTSITGVLGISNGGTGVSSLGTSEQILKVNSEGDQLEWGDIPNVKSFEKISITGQDDVVADSSSDTLTLVAGSGMTITTDSIGDTITFSRSGDFEEINVDDINIDGYTIKNDTGDVEIISTNPDIGGIGTGIIKLNDDVRISNGELYIDIDNYNQKINLLGTNHGVGIDKDGLIYIRGNNGFKIFKGGSHVKGEYSTGGEEIFKIDIDGNVGIGINPTSNLHVNGTTNITGNTIIGGTLDVTGATNINNTTTSTSTTTGALIVDGGVGIAGATNIGGVLNVSSNFRLEDNGKRLKINGGEIYGDNNNGLTFYTGNQSNNSSLILYSNRDALIRGNTTIESIGIADTTLTIKADHRRTASLNLYGTSGQGTGRVYVGQDINYGGGFLYSGDSDPSTIYSNDTITFFRRDNGSESKVFQYSYISDHVNFFGNVHLESDKTIQVGTTDTTTNLEINPGTVNGSGRIGYAFIGYGGVNADAGFGHINYIGNTSSCALKQTSIGGTVLSSASGQDLFFRIAGSDKMRISSSGNVGIGTDNPSSKLHIYNSTVSNKVVENNVDLLIEDAEARLQIISTDSGAAGSLIALSNVPSTDNQKNWVFHHSGPSQDNKLGIYYRENNSSNTDALYLLSTVGLTLDTSGNVGIGTTNPTSRLHVYDTSPHLQIASASNQYSTLSLVESQYQGGGLQFNGNNARFFIGTFSGSSSLNKTLTIKRGSNMLGVNIGDTDPLAQLHVGGSMFMTADTSYLTINPTNNGYGNSVGGLKVQSYWSRESGFYLDHHGNNHRWLIGRKYNGGNYDYNLNFIYSSNKYDSSTQNILMTLKNDGNLGIGTTSPTEKLEVNGNIKGTNFIGNVDGTLDNYDSTRFFRREGRTNATVNSGWISVATCTNAGSTAGRYAGDILVTNSNNTNHAYIRIHWMRSFSDSNFTVLNCGGDYNRIKGARVLYETSNITNGEKILQVYVTNTSNYYVSVFRIGDDPNYGTFTALTPVLEDTKTGFAVHGKELTDLDDYGFAHEEGILAGGNIKAGGDLHVDGSTYYGSSIRQMINLSSTSYGIGVQDSTTYFRSESDFQFYKGGSHDPDRGDAGGGTALLTIKDTGNVGIGTTDPLAELDVVGDIKLTGDLYFDYKNPFVMSDRNGQFVIQAKNSTGIFILRNMNDADLFAFNLNYSVYSFQPVFIVFSASDNFAEIGWSFIGYPGHPTNAGFGHSNFSTDSKSYAIRQTGDGATLLNSKSGQHLYFRIDDADKMRIDSSGKVGIGTTNPLTALHVVGDLTLKGPGYSSSNSGWRINPGQGASGTVDNLQFYANGTLVGYIEDDAPIPVTRLNNFTGQHRSILNQNIDENSVGLIVSSNGTYINLDNTLHANINESLPSCNITTIDNDIKVFGVISDKEDTKDTRRHESGAFITPVEKTNKNEQRIFVNSVGEGAIWVCSKNGNLEIGDYISSSSVPGYGMKQTLDSGTLKNYTVAKITCDCDFSLTKVVKQKLKTVIITETYEEDAYDLIEEEETKTEIVYDEATARYVQKEVTTTKSVSKQIYDTVDLYDESGEVIGSHQIARKVTKTKESRHIDYDSNGDVQFEDDLDPSGTQQMVFPLETRFLLPDATEITEDEYTSRLEAGDEVYVACFVGCTYHCG